jgi:copper chaperone CopZ
MNQRHPVWTLVSLTLAFLPEVVHLWNKLATLKVLKSNVMSNDVHHNQQLPFNAKITLNIPTMGCVACVNKVDSSIRGCSFYANIKEEKSWLKDGKGGIAELIVFTENEAGVNKVVEEVKRAVEKAGFPCEVESILIQ